MKSLRSKLILGSLVLGLGAFNSAPAFAGFDSFGRDIPLESAAKQIVPEGYSINYGKGVDPSVSISWGSARDWQGALSSALSKKGLKAEFGASEVTIVKDHVKASRPYSSSPAKDIVQKKASTERRNVLKREEKKKTSNGPRVQSEQVTHAAAPPEAVGSGGFKIRPYRAPAAAEPTAAATTAPASGDVLNGKSIEKDTSWQKYDGKGQFVVEEGYMLRATLNAWAEATGWTVIWESQHDYLIQANATFNGDFVKASSDLVKAMKDARPQITVDYYANKVIVISNKLSDEVNK